MALTLVVIPPAQTIVSNQAMNYVLSVTNSGATAVTLASLSVSEITESDAQVSQPLYLTPNVSVGVGNPVLAPSTTYYYPFQVVYNSPAQAGPPPQNPGGAAPSSVAVTPDPFFSLLAQSQSSDGTLASVTQQVSVQSALTFPPLAQGGAQQMAQGLNLINFLTLLA